MAESDSDREMKNSENSAFSPLQTCLAMSSSQPYMNITQSPSTLFQSGGQSLSQGRLGSAMASPSMVTRQRNNITAENITFISSSIRKVQSLMRERHFFQTSGGDGRKVEREEERSDLRNNHPGLSGHVFSSLPQCRTATAQKNFENMGSDKKFAT